jgi:hypothetical protein
MRPWESRREGAGLRPSPAWIRPVGTATVLVGKKAPWKARRSPGVGRICCVPAAFLRPRPGKEEHGTRLLGVVSERSSGRLVDRPSREAPHWQVINQQQLACLSQREGQFKLTGLPDEIERVN